MTDNIRLNLDQAFGENPDQYARDREIGRGLGMPPRLLNDSDRSIYRAIRSDTALQGLPVTRRFYGNYDNAVLAQDDSENLGKIEHRLRLRQVREWGEEHRIRSNEPGLWREFGSSVWTGLRRFANNIDLQQADAARQRINDAERWTTFDITQRSLRDPDFDINAYLDEQNAYIAKEEENIRRNVAEYEEDLPALQPSRSEQSGREMQE